MPADLPAAGHKTEVAGKGEPMKFDILIAGVGGQGIILASDILGEAAIAAGYDVKKTDTLGMAQRGGSVISHVRLAEKVASPLIKKGDADILIAFEKLEAARWAHYLKKGGIAIVNNHALPPLSVSSGIDRYPSDKEVLGILKSRTDRIHLVQGTKRASELGNVRTLNMFMLGCVSAFLPMTVETTKREITLHLPVKIQPTNLDAFDAGRKEMGNVHR
jgi:indolepyruvate ferredoxin oxidoreductase beta subunit